MKFWDREKEIGDLKRYLQAEPNAILFVYGPKSSGKSTLLERVISVMRGEKKAVFFKKYRIYWFDLRGRFIPNYESVVDIFFSRERRSSRRQKISSVEVEEPFFRSFKVSSSVYREIKEKELDPFEYMEDEIRRTGRKGIIVFDEIQMLKDVYINGQRKIVDSLFNFFVRITKVLHLAHVLVMTSDTFFIEEVYSSSSLKNTSEYYLVDYFDDETAFKVLVDEGLAEEDARYVVEWIGGVPWMMERVLSNGDVREKVQELYKQHRARLEDVLAESYENGRYDEIVDALRKALEGKLDAVKNRRIIRELVEEEVLFFDPINRTIEFQTKLDEKAAREIVLNK